MQCNKKSSSISSSDIVQFLNITKSSLKKVRLIQAIFIQLKKKKKVQELRGKQ